MWNNFQVTRCVRDICHDIPYFVDVCGQPFLQWFWNVFLISEMDFKSYESDNSIIEVEVPKKPGPPIIEIVEDDIELNIKVDPPPFSTWAFLCFPIWQSFKVVNGATFKINFNVWLQQVVPDKSPSTSRYNDSEWAFSQHCGHKPWPLDIWYEKVLQWRLRWWGFLCRRAAVENGQKTTPLENISKGLLI